MDVLSTNTLRLDLSLTPIRSRLSSTVTTNSRHSGSAVQHPPFFGANFATVLLQSFNCCFSPIASDDDPPLPLPLYIEHVIRSAGLPFEVSTASLIILQRMYMHLMPEIFDLRADFSPYRLFGCAYVLAAKQYQYLRRGTRTTESVAFAGSRGEFFKFTHLQDGTTTSPTPTSLRTSDTYSAQVTGYTSDELQNMQRHLIHTLGGSVAVFQIQERHEREFAEKLKGYPLTRDLPVGGQPEIQNFSRMTTEEQYAYFSSIGRVSALYPFRGMTQSSRREVCEWWQNRAKSYPRMRARIASSRYSRSDTDNIHLLLVFYLSIQSIS